MNDKKAATTGPRFIDVLLRENPEIVTVDGKPAAPHDAAPADEPASPPSVAVQAGEAVGELEVDELGATAFVNDTGRELPYGVYPLYVTRLLSEPAHGAVAQEAVGWQYRVSIDGKTYHDWSDWPNEERPAKIGRWDAEYRAIGVIAPAHPEAAKDAEAAEALAEEVSRVAGFLVGYGDVAEFAAKHLRAALAVFDAALASSKSQGREAERG